MEKIKEKEVEAFKNFVMSLRFQEVIEFFNFIMAQMGEGKRCQFLNYGEQRDAERILHGIGIDGFYCLLKNDGNERGAEHTAGILGEHWEYGFNPWERILTVYLSKIVNYLHDSLQAEHYNREIEEKYPTLLFGMGKTDMREKNIINDIYDLIANNKENVEDDAISSNFDLEVDDSTKTIILWGLDGNTKVTIKVSFEYGKFED